MKKNNQKGFMLVEAFIVSTIVLGVLVFMFVQIRTVINGFDRSFAYNTVPGIYITNELGKFVTQYDYENIKQKVYNNGYILRNKDSYKEFDVSINDTWNEMLKNSDVKNIIIAEENLRRLKDVTDGTFSPKLEDYIDTISVDNLVGQYRIIVEFNDDTYASVKL